MLSGGSDPPIVDAVSSAWSANADARSDRRPPCFSCWCCGLRSPPARTASGGAGAWRAGVAGRIGVWGADVGALRLWTRFPAPACELFEIGLSCGWSGWRLHEHRLAGRQVVQARADLGRVKVAGDCLCRDLDYVVSSRGAHQVGADRVEILDRWLDQEHLCSRFTDAAGFLGDDAS